jgi:hypothetical protein
MVVVTPYWLLPMIWGLSVPVTPKTDFTALSYVDCTALEKPDEHNNKTSKLTTADASSRRPASRSAAPVDGARGGAAACQASRRRRRPPPPPPPQPGGRKHALDDVSVPLAL